MIINNGMINRLSELSMINIKKHENEAITVELKELIGKLQVVSDVEYEECEVMKKTFHKNGDKNRRKKKIKISDINDYVVDNYVVIERTVGEE